MFKYLAIIVLLSGCATARYTEHIEPPPPPPAPAPLDVLQYQPRELATILSAPVVENAPLPTNIPTSPPLSVKKSKQKAVSPNYSKDADEIAMQLHTATVTLDVPQVSNVNDAIPVRLTIDPTTASPIFGLNSTPGNLHSGLVKVSKIVEVSFQAPDAKILYRSPNRQAVSLTELTTWEWELTGLQPGKHKIYITMSAIVTVGRDKAERVIKVLDKEIEIEITRAQQLKQLLDKYWQWLWTTLIAPALVVLWKKYKPTALKDESEIK